MTAAAQRGLFAKIARGVIFALLGLVVLSIACVTILRWVNPPTSAFILRDRFGAWYADDANYRYHHQWMDLRRIAPSLRLAVVASEDQRFPDHRGFDFASINRALEDHERGRRTRGASTITQQVAKNLFLWPGQSWVRKGIEAYFTVLIEALWPKHRILEIYLNVAEFGRGIYGAEAAARAYFKRSAAQLTNNEAALLAAVLPNPKRFNAANPSLYIRSRQHWIVDQMYGLGGPEYLRAMK